MREDKKRRTGHNRQQACIISGGRDFETQVNLFLLPPLLPQSLPGKNRNLYCTALDLKGQDRLSFGFQSSHFNLREEFVSINISYFFHFNPELFGNPHRESRFSRIFFANVTSRSRSMIISISISFPEKSEQRFVLFSLLQKGENCVFFIGITLREGVTLDLNQTGEGQ